MTHGGFLVQVYEDDIGTDLNGDGDLDDAVPHTWHAEGGVTNLGIDAWATPGPDGTLWLESYGGVGGELQLWHPDGELIDTGWTGGSVHPRDDGTALIGVFEAEQGSDLDGDGSLDDHVVVLWDQSSPAVVIGPAYAFGSTADGGAWLSWDERDEADSLKAWHLGLWHQDRDYVDLPYATVNQTTTPDGGLLFRVSESTDYWSYSGECVSGSRDLNGDGDCGDFILYRWSPEAGLADLGLIEAGWCPECDWGYVISGELAFVSQREGALDEDLDGDGEITDVSVLHVVENDSVRNLGLHVTWNTRAWAVLDEGVIVLVPELSEDLNGDGDIADEVFHFVSVSGQVSNLGVGGWLARTLDPGEAALLAEEAGNGRDLNGDGRISDEAYVIHVWSADGGLVSTGITNGRIMDEIEGWRPLRVGALSNGGLVALVPEQEHGHGDLNGDGDSDDLVVHVIARSP